MSFINTQKDFFFISMYLLHIWLLYILHCTSHKNQPRQKHIIPGNDLDKVRLHSTFWPQLLFVCVCLFVCWLVFNAPRNEYLFRLIWSLLLLLIELSLKSHFRVLFLLTVISSILERGIPSSTSRPMEWTQDQPNQDGECAP